MSGNAGLTALSAVKGAPGVLYESGFGIGVRKSVDGGVSFTTLSGGLAGVDYLQVAVDPTNANHVIAGAVTDCSLGAPLSPIFGSTDGGSSWTAIVLTTGCTYSEVVLPVAFGPAGSGRVYTLVNHRLFRSDDDAMSFMPTGLSANAIGVSPVSADILWLGSDLGMRKSSDGGSTVVAYNTGITTNGTFVPGVVSIALHPGYPATPRLWAGTGEAGVFQSSNDGALWSEHNDGLTATEIRALAVHPFDRTRLYAGVSDSLGPSQAFYRSNSIGAWDASNSGLDAYFLRTIVIDPTTAHDIGSTVIYAVGYGQDWLGGIPDSRNGGIYKSVDGGLSWTTSGEGLPPLNGSGHYVGTVRTIALDPRSCASPPPTGPCVSGPLQTLYATSNGRTIAGNRQWRIIKSTDAGLTWASSETGLPGDILGPPGSELFEDVFGVPLVIDPLTPQTLYLGTYAGALDAAGNVATPTIRNGVFKSVDGGVTWVHKSVGLPRYPGSIDSALDVLALAIDPAHPQTLWASTINTATYGSPGQIYKSTDGAEHWTLSNAGVTSPDTRALLVDPSNPSIIYAASVGTGPANPGGVYKSLDGGATWHSISIDLPSSSALVLALDPVDSRVLHAGTNGGVYTITQLPDGDGDGVPDLIENAGPNGGDADADDTLDSMQTQVSTTALGLLGTYALQSGQSDDVEAQSTRLRHTLSNGTIGGYFTVKLISGDCNHSVDVAPVDAGSYGRDSAAHRGTFDYPRGLVHFELPQCTNATVDVIFNGANFDNSWSWRYYGPATPGDNNTMGWHDATVLVTSHSATTWRLHLTAGQFGSYRPAAANSILFVGGPASNDTLFNDGFDD